MGYKVKGNAIFTIALFLATLLVIDPGSEKPEGRRDISGYLPKSGELKGWEPVGAPKEYVGEDLYELINGGAAIYYEYGFRQVITQEYVDEDGRSFNCEIYEMANNASAFGIYSFKIGGDGEEIAVGNDALREDYYLNFWKGNFVVTLTAYDFDDQTSGDLFAIAEAVAAKIEKLGKKPPLVDLLPEVKLKASAVKYLEGNLSLSNNYAFDSENIFGLKEGVIGDYGDYRIFLFKYKSEDECLKWFKNASDHLKDNPRYVEFAGSGDGFSMIDRMGNYICARQHWNYILMFLGTMGIDPTTIFEELKDKIR